MVCLSRRRHTKLISAPCFGNADRQAALESGCTERWNRGRCKGRFSDRRTADLLLTQSNTENDIFVLVV